MATLGTFWHKVNVVIVEVNLKCLRLVVLVGLRRCGLT
jgi:hypothetical protein